jgi:hypothetical protein
MYITKDELYRFHLDSKKAIQSYKLRKHQARLAKLNKSKASKAKAISVLLAASIASLPVYSFA